MSTFERTVCNALIGYDKNERGIGCGKPRCEEAGRRALCLEHWQKLQQERAQQQRQLGWEDRGIFLNCRLWVAKAARILGGFYEISEHNGAEGVHYTIHYRAKARCRGARGRRHWFEQRPDTLELAQAIAQSDHDGKLAELEQSP